MPTVTRDKLLRLTPARYLQPGWLVQDGRALKTLVGTLATAAATQLRQADLSPQELAFTRDAIRLLLPMASEPDPGDRLRAATDEALTVVARAIRQPGNPGLAAWLRECQSTVRVEGDVAAFMGHLEAVAKQYAVLAALPGPDA